MKLVILAVLLASSVARADETPDNESTATTIAVTATAAGAVMIGGAIKADFAPLGVVGAALLVVGPSAGHLYAGEYGHALGMSALRAAAGLTGLVGLIVASTVTYDGPPGANDHANAWAVAYAGAGIYLAATIYDLWDAHRAVRRELTIAPMPAQGGAGLMVAGTF